MAYTAPQIGTILLKADRTMYKIGQIAYENMFAEDNEALDYERDVIFIYKKAVEFADDFFVGTDKLDKVVERLAVKISAYDYGELNPIYADANTVNIATVVAGAALNDLTDVTITNLLDNQFLRYNAATGQWINVGPGAAVRNSQAFTATAGQTVFTTSYPFDSGLFDLYVNGVKLNSLSYTTMGEYQITLNDPCIVGDIVDVVIYDPSTSVSPAVGSLNDLTDVSIGPLANNHVLYYNAATGLWQNAILPSLIGYVPYSGATGDVSLGEYGINVGNVIYDTTPTGIPTEQGATYWDADAETVALIMNGTIQKIGEDTFYHVRNTTGSTIAKGTAVRFSGTTGNSGRLLIAPMLADGTYPSQYYMGITSEEIANNADGKVYHFGKMRNINTSAFADGDVLYVSPSVAGALTATAPVSPNNIIVAAAVVHAANNGTLMIRTTLGSNINSDEGVLLTTPTANQGLFYDSGLWVNKSITTALGYTPVPTTRNITINGVTYDLSADRTYTISTGISGSGTSGQVTYWTGASAVSGSNNLFWDNTNGRLGIGTNTPANTVDVVKNQNASTSMGVTNTTSGTLSLAEIFCRSSNGYISFAKNSALRNAYKIFLANDGTIYNGTAGDISILNDWASGRIKFAAGASSTSQMTLFANGNLAINSGVSDLGVKFGVVGDTLLRGSGATSATTALTVQNSDSTNMFRLNNAGQAMFGTNAQSAGVKLETDGVFRAWTNVQLGQFGTVTINTTQLTKGASGSDLFEIANSSAHNAIGGTYYALQVRNSVTPTSGNAIVNGLVLNLTINQTGGANGITRGLYVNPTLTAAADWRSIEWSNNSGWGLYGSGTAPSFFNGSVGIGTTATGNYNLRVTKNLTGSAIFFNVLSSGAIQSDVTTQAHYFRTGASSANATFTIPNLYHYTALQDSFGASSTITNQYGFFADLSITGATNNYGFYGNISSGTGRWNLYMNGTADNYLAGNLGIGITPTVRLHVSGDTILRGSGATSATTALTVQNSSSTNLFVVRNDGNVGVGTNAPAQVVQLVRNQNAQTALVVTNTTSGTSASASVNVVANNGGFSLAKNSAGVTPYKISGINDGVFYNYSGTNNSDISFLNDDTSGRIKFSAGGAANSQMTLFANGNLAINSGVTDLGVRFGVVGDTLLRGSGATSATTALTVQNSSSTNLFTVRNDGNVGIGTNAPSKIFEISRSIGVNDGIRMTNTGGSGGYFQITNSSGSAFQPIFEAQGSGNVSSMIFKGLQTATGSPTATVMRFVSRASDDSSPVSGVNAMSFENGTTVGFSLSQNNSLLVGTVTDVASSILTIASTTKGFLPPRMTTTQKNAIATPAVGLVVYDTTLNKLCVYTTAWETITSV